MSQKLMGRKLGMIQRFDKDGRMVPCTVVNASSNVISQVKTDEQDRYEAIQTSFEKVEAKDARRLARIVGKPRMGHFQKNNLPPYRFMIESRRSVGESEVGQEVTVDLFEVGDLVDVSGKTKGKGFQGVMRRHGFKGQPASHGAKGHRKRGSGGMRSTPGIRLKGTKEAGHMGNAKRTVQNLEIVEKDLEKGLLFIKGAIPGPKGAVVVIRSSVKKGQPKQ